MPDDATHTVHASIPAHAAADSPEAHWKERPLVFERLHSGTCEVMGETKDLEAAARWALGFGAEATVCSPPALRDEVRRQARQIADRYED